MPGPAFAHGDRVSLHPIEEEDHEFVQYGRNHPDVRLPLTDTRIHTLDDVAEMLEDAEKHFLICASAPEGGDASEGAGEAENAGGEPDPEPVGVVAFTWTSGPPKSGDMMYWVAPEHQGQGYVTEGVELFLAYAFGECAFHKVTAHTLATNEGSIAVLEKLGFEREGHFRDENFVDGDLVDAYRYVLLAEDWGGR